jgi:transmembrane sensor
MASTKAIDAAAASWFAKRDGGEWTEADQAAFDAWLEASVAHRVAFIRIEAAWKHAERLKALGAGIQQGMVPEVGEWQFSPFFENKPPSQTKHTVWARDGKRRVTAWMVAAAILGIVIVSASMIYLTSSRMSDYRTAVGDLKKVPLADGSTVTLNTDSDIGVVQSDRTRTVKLRHGEAFFEVAKDPGRPFVVDAGGKLIIAVGTKFSVRRDGDVVRVAVTEGRVRMEAKGADGAPVSYLKPGEIARADRDSTFVREKPLAQLEAEDLSWRTGYVVFTDLPLGEAVAEFNRYNAKKIEIADLDLATVKIGGSFRVDNVEAFLRLLREGLPVRVEEDDKTITLRRN